MAMAIALWQRLWRYVNIYGIYYDVVGSTTVKSGEVKSQLLLIEMSNEEAFMNCCSVSGWSQKRLHQHWQQCGWLTNRQEEEKAVTKILFASECIYTGPGIAEARWLVTHH